MRSWGTVAVLLTALAMGGCASVTQGTDQSIKVETIVDGGAAIPGAECELQNDKGSSFVRSGESAVVRRSGGNLSIKCALAGQPPAVGQAVSRANAGLAGNVVIGGVIGAAIDVGTGAAFTYPTWIQLVFGQERAYDRSGNRDDGLVTGTFVRATVPGAAPVLAAEPSEKKLVANPVQEPAVVEQPVAKAPTPSPAPVVPVAFTPAAPAAHTVTGAALRRGDALEYVLVDKLTGTRSTVLYQLDRIESDRLIFNQGSRIESLDGKVLSVSSPLGGLFDSSSPPGGWGRKDLRSGMRWHEEYVASNGEKARYELDATVLGDSTFDVDGASLKATKITYKGWMYAAVGVGPAQALPFEATAFYAQDIGRVVKFEAQYRRAYIGLTSESLELTRILR
ncbi:hypothetical protein [Variovorax sp. Sphag1AA]|uniref:hypothetical protein n=1 Tax=Variovorax sp. Sphag1AA TaxID=2587027 RepID=UPI00160DDAFA|nr:hypothetical protein [Variovorax sp. Sphag1AA]MBB3181315.1 hypothetical protein [Variovorax sp. Sphag1AA]